VLEGLPQAAGGGHDIRVEQLLYVLGWGLYTPIILYQKFKFSVLYVLTTQKVGLKDASIADEHMNDLKLFLNPVKSTGQLFFIVKIALPGKDLALARDLIFECLENV